MTFVLKGEVWGGTRFITQEETRLATEELLWGCDRGNTVNQGWLMENNGMLGEERPALTYVTPVYGMWLYISSYFIKRTLDNSLGFFLF